MSQDHGHPRGIASVRVLPDGRHATDAEHLFLPDGMFDRLRRHGVFVLSNRERFATISSALSGLALFAGPSGTGKSSTARALAEMIAADLQPEGGSLFIEVESHDLASDLFGQSQRTVAKLLSETLPAIIASQRFAIVLIDEVEAFAPSRVAASFETNPVDLHRSTDAVLMGIDRFLEMYPRVFIMATTNFPSAVDQAFVSRADLVAEFELPKKPAVVGIIKDTLADVSKVWPMVARLGDDHELLDRMSTACDGLDGRQLRKLVMQAITSREATARDPGQLTADDLLAVVGWPNAIGEVSRVPTAG